MRKSTFALALAFLVAIVWLGLQGNQPRAAEDSKTAVQRWEYGTLRYLTEIQSPDKTQKGPRLVWTDAKGVITGEGWNGMAEKIGAPTISDDTLKSAKGNGRDLDAIRVFNGFGTQGWEMAAYDSSILELTFKRKIEK